MSALALSLPPEKNDMFEISAISMVFASQLCLGSLMCCRSSDDEFWYCALHARNDIARELTANFAVLLTLLTLIPVIY